MKVFTIGLIFLFSSILLSQSESLKIQKFPGFGENLTLRGIYAISSDRALVSGSKGAIFYTTNGGKDFVKINIPNCSTMDFRDVHVTDGNTFFTLSIGGGEKSRIYKSIDEGKNWKLVYKNSFSTGFLNSINFWNRNQGIAVGDPVNGKLQIITTIDSGETWQQVDSANIPPAAEGEAGFAASGTCVAVQGDKNAWIGTGGLKSRIFKTINTGKSWEVFKTPLISTKSSTGIFSVYFSNSRNGIIVGGDYNKENTGGAVAALSRNGGKQWDLIPDKSLIFLSCVSEFKFQNKKQFIATGPESIVFSDKGIIWKQIGKKGYHCLSVSPDLKTIWFAGSKGRVARLVVE